MNHYHCVMMHSSLIHLSAAMFLFASMSDVEHEHRSIVADVIVLWDNDHVRSDCCLDDGVHCCSQRDHWISMDILPLLDVFAENYAQLFSSASDPSFAAANRNTPLHLKTGGTRSTKTVKWLMNMDVIDIETAAFSICSETNQL